MTHLTVYQRLAEDALVLSIRKLALRKLIAFEAAFHGLESERQTIEGAMRHEPSNDGRGTVTAAPSSVSATTVTVSERQRVRDSHDARPAEDRTWERPYSEHHFRRDVRERRQDDGSCVSYRVPTWATELSHEQREKMIRDKRSFTPSLSDDDKPIRRYVKPISIAEERRAAARAIAGTIRMGEQD